MIARKYLEQNLLYIIIAIIAVIITGCHSQPTQIDCSEDKTAVFLVLGDGYAGAYHHGVDPLIPQFNRWYSLPKTKDLVHIFVHPDNLSQVNGFAGHIHPAKAADLVIKINKTLSSLRVNRLLFFIATHGHVGTGDWCYRQEDNCELNESLLLDTFSAYAKTPGTTIKHAIVIPLSCYNKPIMDRFSRKSETTNWPFDVAFISMKENKYCYRFSAANFALKNQIYMPDFNKSRFEDFLNLHTLREFISLSSKYYDVPYEIRHVHKIDKAIFLKDFGFDLEMLAEKFPNPMLPFPNDLSVSEALKKVGFPQGFDENIKRLTFRFAQAGLLPKIIKTNGIGSVIIKDDNLQGLDYWKLEVLIYQTR